jgi:hypothetical protein
MNCLLGSCPWNIFCYVIHRQVSTSPYLLLPSISHQHQPNAPSLYTSNLPCKVQYLILIDLEDPDSALSYGGDVQGWNGGKLRSVDSSARVFRVRRLMVVDVGPFLFSLPWHPQSAVYMLAEEIAKDFKMGR